MHLKTTTARMSSEPSDLESGRDEKLGVVRNEFSNPNSSMNSQDEEFLFNFPEEKKRKAVSKVSFPHMDSLYDESIEY